jgi:hypothetical protein
VASSVSFKTTGDAAASEVSVTVTGGGSVTLKLKDGSVKTSDPGVIAALRSDSTWIEDVEPASAPVEPTKEG